jgi:hypothetical protein
MVHPHGIVEPVIATHQSQIVFHCPCGWFSEKVRPTQPGALRLICTQYREHLDAVGYPYQAGLIPRQHAER